MTKEERAEKWSRGIPEMECLTQQEKEEICRRVTFQLLVLTGILAGAALCCLSFLSLEDPAFFDVLNHSADKVNEIHKNVHSMAKRQGAAVMSLPYVLPPCFADRDSGACRRLFSEEAAVEKGSWEIITTVAPGNGCEYNCAVCLGRHQKNNGASAKR